MSVVLLDLLEADDGRQRPTKDDRLGAIKAAESTPRRPRPKPNQAKRQTRCPPKSGFDRFDLGFDL
ncbi:hypothetical protein E4U43_005180, partial [Claviceps pusilla]